VFIVIYGELLLCAAFKTLAFKISKYIPNFFCGYCFGHAFMASPQMNFAFLNANATLIGQPIFSFSIYGKQSDF